MAKKGTKVEIPVLPPIRLLTTNQPIVPAAEKGQIDRIIVERGTPGKQGYTEHVIYEDKDIVDGVNPFQGNFIFNLVAGALGSGRGERPTAFAAWAVQVQDQFNEHKFFKPLMRYTVVVEYKSRGGTVMYPVQDMLEICRLKRTNILNSIERFPPDKKAPTTRKRTPKQVEVSLTL
jgi:hypothetical protein